METVIFIPEYDVPEDSRNDVMLYHSRGFNWLPNLSANPSRSQVSLRINSSELRRRQVDYVIQQRNEQLYSLSTMCHRSSMRYHKR